PPRPPPYPGRHEPPRRGVAQGERSDAEQTRHLLEALVAAGILEELEAARLEVVGGGFRERGEVGRQPRRRGHDCGVRLIPARDLLQQLYRTLAYDAEPARQIIGML